MSKKKKKGNVEASKAMAAGWLMTYADLMALLMAFFVMLLAAAEVDKAKFDELGKSMKMALGNPITTANTHSSDLMKPFIDEQLDPKKIIEEKIKNDEKIIATEIDAQKISDVLAEQIKSQQVEIETHGRIIVIRMLESGIFESGDADLKNDFKPVIAKLKDELKSINGDIIVSGHADDIPIDNDRFRSNWELSSSRAYSVIDELVKDKSLPGNRFVLRGFGESRPLVPNINAANRAKNRRVEIMIDQRDPVESNSDMEKGQGIEDLPLADAPIPKNVENITDTGIDIATNSQQTSSPDNDDPVPMMIQTH